MFPAAPDILWVDKAEGGGRAWADCGVTVN